MDWNWFFSSLSQSAAAIVGLLGGFVVSKILSNQARFESRQQRIHDAVNKSSALSRSFVSRDFERHIKDKNCDSFLKLKELLDSGTIKSAESFYADLNFSVYSDADKVVEEIRQLIYLHQNHNRPKDRVRIPGDVLGDLAAIGKGLSDATYWPYVRKGIPLPGGDGSGLLEKNYNDAVTLAVLNKILYDEVVDGGESSLLIAFMLVSIGLLFLIGVLAPLMFLPSCSECSLRVDIQFLIGLLSPIKIFFVGLVAVIFLGVLAVLLRMNYSLKYDERLLITLGVYTDVGGFSRYFNNRIDSVKKKASYSFI